MNEFLKDKHYPPLPPILNPHLIATATCYACNWQVMFADRDHYAQSQAQGHRDQTGHKVYVTYKDLSTESGDSV